MKITVVLGTRPELIKFAPIIHECQKRGHSVHVVSTGQHREMLNPLFKFFDFSSDTNLDVMVPNQKLTTLSSKVLSALDTHQSRIEDADFLLVQGDTTSACIAAYWGFCRGIPVAHVEGGLRTYDLKAPFPEEANRQIISRISSCHFAPTQAAAVSLKREKVFGKVHVVGNTAIDALHYTLNRLKEGNVTSGLRMPKEIAQFVGKNPLVLVTAHRRESFGKGFQGICEGISRIADSRDVKVVYPVHPNPNVRTPVEKSLANHPNILLTPPLPYVGFVELMKRADVLLTDSGGIQEEGPSLRKPILVMREETERPEGVKAGFSKLIGTDPKKISKETLKALKNPFSGAGKNPFGDGKSAIRITKILESTYKVKC